VDIPERTLEVDLSEAELEERLDEREAPEPPYTNGVLAKYVRDFGSAANGAVTNPGVQWDR
jgi:dihydroxy-acid dehydratase